MKIDEANLLATTQPDSIRIISSPTGHGYRLEATQFLSGSRDEIFAFFSDAFQLETLTPDWLNFSVLTPPPIHITEGTLIDYKLRVHHIPLHWESRINEWEPPVRFVDEQIHGPYRYWHHEHRFEEAPAGTICHDVVDYDVYGGTLINAMFVRRDLLKIFKYRQDKLHKLFPDAKSI